MTIDHDRLFKELISAFFIEFIELFFPDLAKHIDPSSLTLLDKELFVSVTAGDKFESDLVAKVKYRSRELFFLILVENQSQHQNIFPKRIFNYFSLIHEKYSLPVYPIAIFSFDSPKTKQPECYKIEFPDFNVLQFNYRVIQLNRINWRDYLNRHNPVVSALMAKMNIPRKDRPKVKLECLRLLATLKLDPAKTQLISGFVDTYLRLNGQEERILLNELQSIDPVERKSVMEIVTSWMEQGKHQEALSLIKRQLNKRVGEQLKKFEQRIDHLTTDQLELLADALLDFRDKSDLATWLDNNP
jgi:hypothetical protein